MSPEHTEIYKKNAAAQVEPRTQTHTLCKPAQSTRTSRFHKSHFMWKFAGKVPRPQNEPRTRTHILCEPAQLKRMSTFHSKWAQNADTHFVRACALETHVKIEQEPINTEIYKKNATPKNADTHFVRACAVETHVKIWQKPLYAEIYKKNAAPQSEHPDQAPALTATVRTLSVDTLFGKHLRAMGNNGFWMGLVIRVIF